MSRSDSGSNSSSRSVDVVRCGFSIFDKPEDTLFYKAQLETRYTGTIDTIITKPGKQQTRVNGVTVSVIDVKQHSLDINMVYSPYYLKTLEVKDIDNECDAFVNAVEYIQFIKTTGLKFPLRYLFVLVNVPELENAFWNGSYIVIGNGVSNRSTQLSSPGIIGHELTHCMIQAYPKLDYKNQSGALNESYADIFGAMFDFYLMDKRQKGFGFDLGEEIYFDHHDMKSFEDPEMCGQPSKIDSIYVGDQDNGGVHINSGIINHLFYKLQLNIDRKIVFKYFINVFMKLRHNADFFEFKSKLVNEIGSNDVLNNIINESIH